MGVKVYRWLYPEMVLPYVVNHTIKSVYINITGL